MGNWQLNWSGIWYLRTAKQMNNFRRGVDIRPARPKAKNCSLVISCTLPETNSSPLENDELEYDCFLLGPSLFSCAMPVSFKEGFPQSPVTLGIWDLQAESSTKWGWQHCCETSCGSKCNVVCTVKTVPKVGRFGPIRLEPGIFWQGNFDPIFLQRCFYNILS